MARLTAAQVASIIKKEFRFANTDGINEFVTEKQLQKLIASLAVTVEKLVDGVGVDAASTTEQVVQSRTIDITRADILALGTTPIELLPELASGEHYIILPSIMKRTSWGAAYAFNGSTSTGYMFPVKQGSSTGRWMLDFNCNILFEQARTASRSLDREDWNGWGVPSLTNEAVYILPYTNGGVAATVTGGVGTEISITINYIIAKA